MVSGRGFGFRNGRGCLEVVDPVCILAQVWLSMDGAMVMDLVTAHSYCGGRESALCMKDGCG